MHCRIHGEVIEAELIYKTPTMFEAPNRTAWVCPDCWREMLKQSMERQERQKFIDGFIDPLAQTDRAS